MALFGFPGHQAPGIQDSGAPSRSAAVFAATRINVAADEPSAGLNCSDRRRTRPEEGIANELTRRTAGSNEPSRRLERLLPGVKLFAG